VGFLRGTDTLVIVQMTILLFQKQKSQLVGWKFIACPPKHNFSLGTLAARSTHRGASRRWEQGTTEKATVGVIDMDCLLLWNSCYEQRWLVVMLCLLCGAARVHSAIVCACWCCECRVVKNVVVQILGGGNFWMIKTKRGLGYACAHAVYD
jgi:hypothetical protein